MADNSQLRVERKLTELRGRDLKRETCVWLMQNGYRSAASRRLYADMVSTTVRNAMPLMMRSLTSNNSLLKHLTKARHG